MSIITFQSASDLEMGTLGYKVQILSLWEVDMALASSQTLRPEWESSVQFSRSVVSDSL